MDRSRRQGAQRVPATPASPAPPPASRLTVKPRPNRRKPTAAPSLWARVPRPAAVADACGRALRRAVPAIIGLAVIGTIGGTAWAGYRFVTTSPRFAIDDIAIHGNHHLTVDQIRQALPVAVGDNVFATDLDTVVRELRTNPWIAEAEAHRILPHTIVVDVREHEPIALVDLGGLYLVDAQGRPFKRAAIEADEGAALPIITGLPRVGYLANPDAAAHQVAAALGALADWRREPTRPAIGEIHVGAHGDLTLHTYDQATAIQLGAIDAGLPARMRTFDIAWNELGDAERSTARAIHLDTRPDHVTVAFTQKDL